MSVSGCRKILDGLDDLLRDAATLIPLNAPTVILTGEYIPENFFVSAKKKGGACQALSTSATWMTGCANTTCLARAPSMTGGNAASRSKSLSGVRISKSGYQFDIETAADGALLLHRSSDPSRHICIEGWQQKAVALAGLTIAYERGVGKFALTIGKDDLVCQMGLPFLRHPFGSRKFNYSKA